MTDNLTSKQRSYCMSQIKSRNTRLELKLRNELKEQRIKGYFTKNKITGKPDIYFPKKKLAIFIDGCFWHKCPKCFKQPKSNKLYWCKKIEKNYLRDKSVNTQLKKEGIKVLRIWEHELKSNMLKQVKRIMRQLK